MNPFLLGDDDLSLQSLSEEELSAIRTSVAWFQRSCYVPYVGLIFDERMQQHSHPYGEHVERPERTKSIIEALKLSGLAQRMYSIPLRTVKNEELLLIHTPEHISFVNSLANSEVRDAKFSLLEMLSAYANEGTVEAAYISVSCVLSALDKIHENIIKSAICVVRPPGHHAEKDQACGFCFFDNVAIAAAVAIEKYQFKKVLILGRFVLVH